MLHVNLMVTTKKKHSKCTKEKEKKYINITLKKTIKPQGKREREKETEEHYKNNQKTIKEMAISAYLSIITLNVNGLNYPIERHKVAKWIFKKTYMLCLRDSFQT